MVVLLTSFDGWLKPDVKYRIHYMANDTYTRLIRKLSLVPPPTDPHDSEYLQRLDRISEEFDLANEKYSGGII
jgi:hypothetical protein